MICGKMLCCNGVPSLYGQHSHEATCSILKLFFTFICFLGYMVKAFYKCSAPPAEEKVRHTIGQRCTDRRRVYDLAARQKARETKRYKSNEYGDEDSPTSDEDMMWPSIGMN